jgi:mannosyltransferase OCH1-like enzyme
MLVIIFAILYLYIRVRLANGDLMPYRDRASWIRDSVVIPLQKMIPRTNPTPKIIHRYYTNQDELDSFEHFKDWINSCEHLNTEYQHIIWTKTSVRDFLSIEYPMYMVTYNGFVYERNRFDLAKYLILNKVYNR